MRFSESTLGPVDHDPPLCGICSVILKIEAMDVEELEGQIESVVYTNEENGYTVAQVRLLDTAAAKPGKGNLWHQGRENLVTVVGTLVSPTPGELIRMKCVPPCRRWDGRIDLAHADPQITGRGLPAPVYGDVGQITDNSQ